MYRVTEVKKLMATLSLLVAVCVSDATASLADAKIKVITTLLPFKEFVETVGGNGVEVSALIPPGASPHTYELAPSQLREVSQARLYVKTGSGVEFEEVWLEKIVGLNEKMVVCNSSESLELREMESDHHNDGDEYNDHHGKDPHVWLSPRNAKIIVENVRDCFIQLDPSNIEVYHRNAQKYIRQLDDLDRTIQERLSELPDRWFIVFHPAWGYFARDYNLNQIAIQVQGKEPSPKYIVQVIEKARKLGIKTLFVSPQANPKTAQLIATEIRGTVAFANPLAEHYIENLQGVAELISKSYE